MLYPPEICHQGVLEKVVHDLFPGRDIITNTQKSLRNPVSGRNFEIDVWIPSLSLGFEFQDLYHFGTAWYYHRPLSLIQDRDSLKKDVLLYEGKTLVQVPYWWNSSSSSLVASIKFIRPDLFPEVSSETAIPLNPPNLSPLFTVPEIGELMLASVVPSVGALDESLENTSWWMGEKYDGVRCVWNHSASQLYTRRGQSIDVPVSIKRHLILQSISSNWLDAELWCGRGAFLECQTLVTTEPHTFNWVYARLIAFDNPLPLSHSIFFEERYGTISQLHVESFLIVAPRVKTTSKILISYFLQNILQDGGEGVILRKSNSLLESGRSTALLKIKTMRGDTEALVVQVDEMHGECKLKLPSGIKFSVDSRDIQLEIGDIVTLEYDSYSQKNIPVNPKITRVRKDMSWDNVLLDYAKEKKDLPERIVKPAKYWTSEKGKHMRGFFEDFARSLGLNPLVPETWYSIPRKIILLEKEARSFLVGFAGNHVKALMTVFPDLDLRADQFSTLPTKFWTSLKNRREFFDKFAALENFDPLVAENWYSIKRESISSQKGYLALVLHYHRDYISALIHLYPDIGLERAKFSSWNFWKEAANRRNFFYKVAEKNSFSPLVPENWYSFTQRQISELEDSHAVLSYHRGSFVTALTTLFPRVEWVKEKFSEIHWVESKKRRYFFESLAQEMRFDPLIPFNWYWIPRRKIYERKDAAAVMSYHKNDYTLAIKQLFPQIGIIRSKFKKMSFYRVRSNRRKFFDGIATKLGFDPLVASNWLKLSRQTIISQFKDGATVLSFYKNSLSGALKRVYPNLSFLPPLQNMYKDDHPKKLEEEINWKSVTSRRAFFDQVAHSLQIDPLVPSNWFPISHDMILAFKGAPTIMRYYGNNLCTALTSLYPSLQTTNFTEKYQIFQKFSKRLNEFAKEREFNPLNPANWYNVTTQNCLANVQGIKKLVDFCDGDIGKALEFIFPNIGIETNKFLPEIPTPRKVFDEFAKLNSFDPLVAENWYKVTLNKILSMKSSETILAANGGNLAQTLSQIYPKISFDANKFKFVQKQYWKDLYNQRNFFSALAHEKGFDPKIAQNWYSTSYWDIKQQKKASSVLAYYSGNYKQALIHVFPDLRLEESKFVV